MQRRRRAWYCLAAVLPILGVAAWHGLPSSATPLGGWEAPNVELPGHSVGHDPSALALMYASTGDARFKARGDLMVAELATVQQAAAAKGRHEGFLSSLPKGSRSCDSERSSRG